MAELFKFRCYQCQKTIGAPPSRFGKVVKCPRCEAELIVPSPDQVDSEPEVEDPDAFRPEEFGINLEPERLLSPKPKPATSSIPSPSSVLQTTGPDPVAFLSRSGDTPDPDSADRSGSAESSAIDPELLPKTKTEPLVGRDRRALLARADVSPRARDVILPRTGVVAWALFALFSLAFTFTSGLLIGHFLWK